MILVASRTSKSNRSANSSSNSCRPSSHSGKSPCGDGVPQVAAVEVGVGAVDLDRLVPGHRLQPLLRLPVELDVGRPAVGVDQAEGVHPEPLHEPERARDRPVGHDPHQHVGGLGHQRREVPEVVVRGLRLREPAVRFLLGRVDQVGELDRVLDEEHRDVVADQVPVPLPGVELGREPADVAGQVGGPLVPGDGGEPDERRRAQARLAEDVGPGDVGQRLVVLEVAVRAVTAGVDHPLGDPLVVEVEDLLPEVRVLQQRRAPLARPQRVLVVADHTPCWVVSRGLPSPATWCVSPPWPRPTCSFPYCTVCRPLSPWAVITPPVFGWSPVTGRGYPQSAAQTPSRPPSVRGQR